MKNQISSEDFLILDRYYNFLVLILKGCIIASVIIFGILSVVFDYRFIFLGLVALFIIAFYLFNLNKNYKNKEKETLTFVRAKCTDIKLYHLRYHQFIFTAKTEDDDKGEEFSLIFSNKNKYKQGKEYLFCINLDEDSVIGEIASKDVVLSVSPSFFRNK